MKILILGGDGYLGWPTGMYFSQRGHDVALLDNGSKRDWEAEVGGTPLFSTCSRSQSPSRSGTRQPTYCPLRRQSIPQSGRQFAPSRQTNLP